MYNKDLNELKISWRTTPDPKLYKGVEVSFQALGGQSKTIRIMANPNFSSSYDYFTVVTKNPIQFSIVVFGIKRVEKKSVSGLRLIT